VRCPQPQPQPWALRACSGPGPGFLVFLFGVAHFDAALQDRALFDADAVRDHVAGEYAFAAHVQSIGALDVALHLAHDDDFIGRDVGRDDSVAADRDAIVGKLIVPSTRPSMNSDSEPDTSPLMTSERPIVACSPASWPA